VKKRSLKFSRWKGYENDQMAAQLGYEGWGIGAVEQDARGLFYRAERNWVIVAIPTICIRYRVVFLIVAASRPVHIQPRE
jgi:hypothetical protein